MLSRFSSRRRRERQASGLPEGPLKRLLLTPTPTSDTPLAELSLLAVDVETTGLDPATDTLLGIGFVPVDGSVITLAGAGSMVLRAATEVGQSARFHGITDDQLAAGTDVAEALGRTLEAMRGRVLLAHHALLEQDFLGLACERLWGVRPQFATVDTMLLHAAILTRGDAEVTLPANAVRLWNARDRYGLPRYRAHHALTDALACAELYLAQSAEVGARTLGALQRFSR
ncbi:DNA polymerase III subunit epsilon [Naumannella sp. ID2617S]|uniref:DNA polymerase III subunit epsilon n=1 Tax=Enemella dayhoffiae TaxID=2016507 RepID=A0A255HDF6_9ACTN|nr:exonuclease domain-containing protein [Enemella dayhoffiae]NNG19700.1 DNA polymerase III subunit epsilon [Naumannella sp. ID2617S]OYO24963.1 DNA polymerase III subunit epsilon [Enemella dayhoffiae]